MGARFEEIEFKTLGVTPDANEDEIKRAFRKAASKYHPDTNKDAGAEAKFKEVNEAYEVLKDPDRRMALGCMNCVDFARYRKHGSSNWYSTAYLNLTVSPTKLGILRCSMSCRPRKRAG